MPEKRLSAEQIRDTASSDPRGAIAPAIKIAPTTPPNR